MRQFRIPLAGSFSTRIDKSSTDTSLGIAGIGVAGIMVAGKTAAASQKDRRFQNCFNHVIDRVPYLLKRPGFAALNTPAAGNIGSSIMVWSGQGTGQKVITAFGATNSTIYDGTTSLGTITGMATGITETFVGTEATLVISSNDNTAWSVSGTSVTYGGGTGLTFVGDTHSNTTVDNITVNTATLGLVVGQLLTGTGFAANTRIVSIAANSIVVSVATTATNAGVTITRTYLGKIIDADFPGNAGYTLAGTFAHIDGFACIMTNDGKLWASDLNTVTAWTATSYDSANAYPDKGVGCIRRKNFIMAFGTNSLEFFYNAGLTPFPLSKAKSMTEKVGAFTGDADADTIAQISDTIFWGGSLPEGGISIYQYDGSISRISTPELDEMLGLVGPNNISLTTERWYGLSFVVVNANLTTYVYCIEDKTWWERPGTRLWYRCAGNSIGNTLYTYGISNTSTSGKVYVINPTAFTFQDDSVAYTAVWQTSPEDNGTSKRKFCGEIDLVCDREIEASALTLMYSDDDYETFTTWGAIDLSDARPRATRLGSYIRRAWRGEHSANTPFRIRYLEGQVEIGQ